MNEKLLLENYCNNYHLKRSEITIEMVMQHWNLERELAGKMRSCPSQYRGVFFKECYDELYRSCPWLVPTGISEEKPDNSINWWANSSLSPEARILEIGGGAGNCAKKLSEQGFSLTCIDLSEERVIQAQQGSVPKIRFKVGDATALDFPPDTFDVVYSHQMIEHLHPDDVPRHFDEVFRVLKKGGFYYFTTPNRLWGPSDVSRLFGFQTAAGMHLKEYSYDEIRILLNDSGFYNLKSPLIHPYLCDKLKISPLLVDIRKKCMLERILKILPGFINNIPGRVHVVKSTMVVARK